MRSCFCSLKVISGYVDLNKTRVSARILQRGGPSGCKLTTHLAYVPWNILQSFYLMNKFDKVVMSGFE